MKTNPQSQEMSLKTLEICRAAYLRDLAMPGSVQYMKAVMQDYIGALEAALSTIEAREREVAEEAFNQARRQMMYMDGEMSESPKWNSFNDYWQSRSTAKDTGGGEES